MLLAEMGLMRKDGQTKPPRPILERRDSYLRLQLSLNSGDSEPVQLTLTHNAFIALNGVSNAKCGLQSSN